MKLFFIFLLISLFLFLISDEVNIRANLTETFEISPDSTLLYIYRTYTIKHFTWTDTITATITDIDNQILNIKNEIKQILGKESEFTDEYHNNYRITQDAIKQRKDTIDFWEKYRGILK